MFSNKHVRVCVSEEGSSGNQLQYVYLQFFIIPLWWVVQQPLLESKYQRRAFAHKCWADLWPGTFCRGATKIVLVNAHYLEQDRVCVCVTSFYWSYQGYKQSKKASVKSFLKACSVSSHLTPHPEKYELDRRKQAAVGRRACPANDVGYVPFWEGQSHAAVSTDVVE